jgi:hypothetical protein
VGTKRVPLAKARVLQVARRANGSATGGVASKYDREQSAFKKLNT